MRIDDMHYKYSSNPSGDFIEIIGEFNHSLVTSDFAFCSIFISRLRHDFITK